MTTLGAVVFSLQGMEHLSRCLESVRWMDAVRVCALEDPLGEGGREIGTDWVLHLWGEEEVGEGLALALREVVRLPLASAPQVYTLSIRSYLLGRWVTGSLWGPTPALRLHRNAKGPPGGWWDQTEVSHSGSAVLEGWIEDHSCVTLNRGVDTVNRLSSFWAERMRRQGRAPRGAVVATYPLWIFTRHLLFQRLACQGLAGVSLSALAAYAALATAMKNWEKIEVRSP